MSYPVVVTPELELDNVHIWWVRIRRDIIERDMLDVLSRDEKQRALKFRFDNDRQTFVCARYALRALLGSYLTISAGDLQFNYSEHGKPTIDSGSIHFNVSHSGDRAVVAITRVGPIGADIEFVKPAETFPDEEVLQVGRHFFSEDEYRRLSQIELSKRRLAFFQCWTRKEAFIKAEGSGLTFPLDQFEVSFGDDQPFKLLKTHWDATERRNWSVSSFDKPAYVAAAAVRGSVLHWLPFEFQFGQD